jgi:cell division septation protein DedD
MHEVFDEEDFKPGEHRRDTELTLGPMLLVGLISGLVLLCGLCFWLGYTIGSHSGRNAAATAQQNGAEAALPSAGFLAKPSAGPQSAAPQQGAAESQPPPDTTDASAPLEEQDTDSSASSEPPAVRPTLHAATASAQPATTLRSAPAGGLMVQIAIVSQQEDADVLVGALRRRGFAAGIRREPADGKFHVRIGPFSSRSDAYATRQKLINDGYNAVVQ